MRSVICCDVVECKFIWKRISSLKTINPVTPFATLSHENNGQVETSFASSRAVIYVHSSNKRWLQSQFYVLE